jgi:hypothetical protein
VLKSLRVLSGFFVLFFVLLMSEVFLAAFSGFFLIICEMLSGIFTKFHTFLVEIVSYSWNILLKTFS